MLLHAVHHSRIFINKEAFPAKDDKSLELQPTNCAEFMMGKVTLCPGGGGDLQNVESHASLSLPCPSPSRNGPLCSMPSSLEIWEEEELGGLK